MTLRAPDHIVRRAGRTQKGAETLFRLHTLNKSTTLLDCYLPLFACDVKNENSSHTCIINTSNNDKIILYARPDAPLNTPPTNENLLGKKGLGNHCKAASLQVCQPNTDIRLNDQEFLARKCIVNDPIPIFVQKLFANKCSTFHNSLLCHDNQVTATYTTAYDAHNISPV